MTEAIIFDMDGLLVDSEPLWQRARVECFGAERLRWTDEDQAGIMGRNTLGWATFLQDRLGTEFTMEEIIERIVSQMEAYYHIDVPLMPGAHELIEQLRGRYPLGLASGAATRMIRAVLDSTGWEDAFVEILSGDDVEHGKPAPDMYLEIAKRMGVDIKKSVVFEDSGNGILSGYTAGAKVIAVPSYYHRPPDDVLNKAALVIPSLAGLTLDVIDRLA
jgi:HAD superfamily hydrolase (TIGR01509 family)